jgi:disulfide bond formation protein DsbB
VSKKLVLVALTVCLAAFLYNGGLSFYHAGAEYGFWPGPESCGGGVALPGSVEELQARLSAGEHPPRCDEAAWTLFGVSLAGFNFLISLLLSALSAAPVAHYLQNRKEKA